MNEKTTETMLFRMPRERSTASEVLISVYESMREKGYDPINQIVGYLISGDPTYITSYNNARYRICSLQRDELVEELVRFYIQAQDAAAMDTFEGHGISVHRIGHPALGGLGCNTSAARRPARCRAGHAHRSAHSAPLAER